MQNRVYPLLNRDSNRAVKTCDKMTPGKSGGAAKPTAIGKNRQKMK